MLHSRLAISDKLLSVQKSKGPAVSFSIVSPPVQINENVKLFSFGSVFKNTLYRDQGSSCHVPDPDW